MDLLHGLIYLTASSAINNTTTLHCDFLTAKWHVQCLGSLSLCSVAICVTIMICRKEETVLIVGGGCFGISTAYHLLKRGFKSVTVVDRSNVLPAPDAASTDLSALSAIPITIYV